MSTDEEILQRLSSLEDDVEVELSGVSSQLQTSQAFAVQLNTKLDISLAKTDNLQQQISTLGNRLTSLEGAFSSFTVDVNRSISELISRFDAVQASCLRRSEAAAHGKIVLLRSVQRHSSVVAHVAQTDLVKAHGILDVRCFAMFYFHVFALFITLGV